MSQHHGGGANTLQLHKGKVLILGDHEPCVLWRHPARTGVPVWDVGPPLLGCPPVLWGVWVPCSQILVLPRGQGGQGRALCRKDPICCVWGWFWLFRPNILSGSGTEQRWQSSQTGMVKDTAIVLGFRNCCSGSVPAQTPLNFLILHFPDPFLPKTQTP